MNKALAASFLIGGIVPFAWAVITWWKSRQGRKNGGKEIHHKWVAVMLILGCAGIGIGSGGLAGFTFFETKFGFIALWIPFVLIVAFLFVLEMKGYEDHPTRTPILGGVTAFVLFVAIGNGLVNWGANQIQHVQTTGIVQQAHK
jgi:hypothetical protein